MKDLLMFISVGVVVVIAAPKLQADGVGVLALAALSAYLAFTLAVGGIIGALESGSVDWSQNPRGMVGNLIFIAVVWGGVICLAGILSRFDDSSVLMSFQGEQIWNIAFTAAPAIILLEIAQSAKSGLCRGRTPWLGTAVYTASLLVGVMALKAEGIITTHSIAAIWTISLAAAAAAQTFSAFFSAGFDIIFDDGEFRRLIRLGFKYWVPRLFTFMRVYMNIFLVAYMLTIEDAGVYAVAMLLANVALYLPPAASERSEKRHRARVDPSAILHPQALIRVNLAFSLLTTAALVAIGWLILDLLFGPGFGKVYPAMALLLPGVVMRALVRSISADESLPQDGAGEGWLALAFFSLGIALSLPLISLLGIFGASIASSVTALIAGITWLKRAERAFGIRIRGIWIPRGNDWSKPLARAAEKNA